MALFLPDVMLMSIPTVIRSHKHWDKINGSLWVVGEICAAEPSMSK